MSAMLVLRYVYVLAIVVWLGGMVILGAIVAPTTFQVLEARLRERGSIEPWVFTTAFSGEYRFVPQRRGGGTIERVPGR